MGKTKDLKGMRFGKLLVVEKAIPPPDKKDNRRTFWKCICDCQANLENKEYVFVAAKYLLNGSTKSCGCLKTDLKEDLTGKKFNRLTVISRAEDRKHPSGKNKIMWNCICDCQLGLENPKIIQVEGRNLVANKVKSCGCLKQEVVSSQKKENIYDLTSQDYGIGYASNTGKEFWFDKEDYEKIKKHCWSEIPDGYFVTSINNKQVSLQRFVMNKINAPRELKVDHIKHRLWDNRKSQLRITNHQTNAMNHIIARNNTSGVTGVSWETESQKWHSYIWINGKTIHLGRYDDFNEAVKTRKEAEEKYFGQYSYDNSMKHEE